MRSYKLVVVAVLVACGGGSDTKQDAAVADVGISDAPGIAPMLTSFVPTPSQVPANTPSAVTWNWTYAYEPTYPDPTCSIDHGVGPVTRGQTTMVTLTAVTLYTITCINYAGTGAKQAVVAIPPASPTIGSFTATPSTVPSSSATDITFSWTYSGYPSPAPSCTIDGVAATSGMTMSVTLTNSRTYQLKCTNSQGTSTSLVTVNFNECAAGAYDCQTNASCVDQTNGYTCQCNTPTYTGNGDVCSTAVACTVGTVCDSNATCVGGTSCQCNAGYVGNGLACTREKITFVTSTTGQGNLSTWAGAGGQVGMTAADNICQARAVAAGLPNASTPGAYVAWVSDSLTDAYCHVQGLTGKKANCGTANAGPWIRRSVSLSDYSPVAPTIDKLVAPTRQTFYPAIYDELGNTLGTSERIYTGTDELGAYSTTNCTDWTSTSVTGTMGDVYGGGTSWTAALAAPPSCANTGHLRCVETGVGPALPTRHAVTGKKAFLTSVFGTGNFSTWADAGGQTGIAAADAICQARARFMGFANTLNFKAWMSSSSNLTSRIVTSTSPYVRPDGIVLGTTRSDMVDSRLAAAFYQTDTGAYAAGNDDVGSVWTGSNTTGTATFVYCSVWTTTASTGTVGRFDTTDGRYLYSVYSNSCTPTDYRLYCVED